MSMKIVENKNIKVKDLVEGYMNDPYSGQVTTMNGRLNVRPAYQREFVWDKGSESGGKKQAALIDSIMHGYPINVTKTRKDTTEISIPSTSLHFGNAPHIMQIWYRVFATASRGCFCKQIRVSTPT